MVGEGNGPVNALDHAVRNALLPAYPAVEKFELIDYRVRILDQGHGTDATVRVLIETTDGLQRLDHGRGRSEHHRGLLGGALRRLPLRPDPRRDDAPTVGVDLKR